MAQLALLNVAFQERDYGDPFRNRMDEADRPFHDWYRFVLSFPPHLVRHYLLSEFGLRSNSTVLDPFCGTGTTAIEAQFLKHHAVGIEANHIAHFASCVKTNWSVKPDGIEDWAKKVGRSALATFKGQRKQRTLSEEETALLLTDSICPGPLNKLLVLRSAIDEHTSSPYRDIGRLALAKTAVQTASNLHFGPEVGVRGRKLDAPVFEAWESNVRRMAADLQSIRYRRAAEVHCADARHIGTLLESGSVHAVFTSPPYPNEKDYTRTTRLESVLLGFLTSKEDLRTLKRSLVRSNTRNVYKMDDDDRWVKDHDRINTIAEEIEARRVRLGKTSGFEKLYSKVTRLYFGGIARHLDAITPVLRLGAYLAYVVGDQASYLQVHIPTGELVVDLAKSAGFEHVRTDLFRTRIATATKKQMKEEVVMLRWPS